MTHPNSVYRCYRLTSLVDYDEELVWRDVQSFGGSISIRGDCIDFWVPYINETWMILRWPRLVRRADLDLVDHRAGEYQF
jgi:hypothetical protein